MNSTRQKFDVWTGPKLPCKMFVSQGIASNSLSYKYRYFWGISKYRWYRIGRYIWPFLPPRKGKPKWSPEIVNSQRLNSRAPCQPEGKMLVLAASPPTFTMSLLKEILKRVGLKVLKCQRSRKLCEELKMETETLDEKTSQLQCETCLSKTA